MTIIFIGVLGINCKPLLEYMAKNKNYEVKIVNIGNGSYEWGNNKGIKQINVVKEGISKIEKKVRKGRGRWFKKSAYSLIIEGSVIDAVKKSVKESTPDLIFTSWGRTPLPEMRYIKREFSDIPFVHDFRTYPVSRYKTTEYIENLINKEVIENMDGMIFTSETMKKYIENRFENKTKKAEYFSEYIPEKMFFRKNSIDLDIRSPNIIFLGNRKRDLSDIFRKVLKKGIDLYACNKVIDACSSIDTHRNIHTFSEFSTHDVESGKFSNFISNFDASILVYPNSYSSRFRNTHPERLLWSIAGGLPILLPESKLKASEQYVLSNGIGITFKNIDGMSRKVKDGKLIDSVRENLRGNIDRFKLENNFSRLDGLFKSVL